MYTVTVSVCDCMMIHRYSKSRKFTEERSVGNDQTSKTPPRYTTDEIAGSKGMLSVYIVALIFYWYGFFLVYCCDSSSFG